MTETMVPVVLHDVMSAMVQLTTQFTSQRYV